MDRIERTRERFGLRSKTLVADTGSGSAETLGRRVEREGIEAHIPVINRPAGVRSQSSRADKSRRTDGTFSPEHVAFDGDAGSSAAARTDGPAGGTEDAVLAKGLAHLFSACDSIALSFGMNT